MRAESARVCEVAENPTDWQHANQRDKTDNADRDVALGDRQRIRLAGLARARRGHRARETVQDRFAELQQGPNRGNPNRTRADEPDFVAPRALSERASRSR